MSDFIDLDPAWIHINVCDALLNADSIKCPSVICLPEKCRQPTLRSQS